MNDFLMLSNKVSNLVKICAEISTHPSITYTDGFPFLQCNIYLSDAAYKCFSLHKKYNTNIPNKLISSLDKAHKETDQAIKECDSALSCLNSSNTNCKSYLHTAYTETLQANEALGILFQEEKRL